MIVINLKAYTHSTGKHAIAIAKAAEKVSLETGIPIVVCPNALDLYEVRQSVHLDIYTQHIDPIDAGAYTGYISAHLAREKGADGTILNHSEHKLDWNTLVSCVTHAKEEGLGIILCAETIDFAVKQLELFPNEIALEIPALIASNLSISKANPTIIKDAVARIGEGKILVGSGIRTADDAKASLDMGVKGIIIASAIDLTDNPERILISFAKAFI